MATGGVARCLCNTSFFCL